MARNAKNIPKRRIRPSMAFAPSTGCWVFREKRRSPAILDMRLTFCNANFSGVEDRLFHDFFLSTRTRCLF